jgi:nitric oxide reductase NorD protein
MSTRDNQSWEEEIVSLFPVPLYTGTHIYFEDDLAELGLGTPLGALSAEKREVALGAARTLASIRPELAFHFLQEAHGLLELIRKGGLERWIQVVLEIYDSQGLNPAREFICNPQGHPRFQRFWGQGVSFHETANLLLTYLNGLSRNDMRLEVGVSHYTDTQTIFLPERLSLFPDDAGNFLLYKMMVTHKHAQCRLGTYRFRSGRVPHLTARIWKTYGLRPPSGLKSELSRFLHMFPEVPLAVDLMILGDTIRVEAWIQDHLPGLHRNNRSLKKALYLLRKTRGTRGPKSQIVDALLRWWFTDTMPVLENPVCTRILENARRGLSDLFALERTIEDVAEVLTDIYGFVQELPGDYEPVELAAYMGELRPEEAEQTLRQQRESRRMDFQRELARVVGDLPEPTDVRIEIPGFMEWEGRSQEPQPQQVPESILVDGNPIPVPAALQKTIQEIYEDLGAIPSSYLAVADEMSGHYFHPLCRVPEGTGYFLSESGDGVHALDEWDFRRQGYRKRWVLLQEKEAPEGGLEFVRETLDQYRGVVGRIKRQFERIRLESRVMRRQTEGDELDLDAAVEALSDLQAGLHPSDRLFAQLRRDRRDIAAVFLIDLSGSTSGWINEVERMSLLILCEALEVLGDSFAVYGFSGRTRKRCELYRVKGMEEPYGEIVQRRIANLRPLEYTRMGPPIRHLTGLMEKVEARTKLMITLSDGKPDDYDGYKGEYGIEDTRQALMEAKRAGIHPFCITIDRAEHRYISHMYGAVNYVFIDDLSQLPVRVPEIYRKLTT